MGSSVDSDEAGLTTVLSEIQDPVLALDRQEIRTLNDAARDVCE